MTLSSQAIADYREMLVKKSLPIPKDVASEAQKMLTWAASFMRPIPKKEMEMKNVKE